MSHKDAFEHLGPVVFVGIAQVFFSGEEQRILNDRDVQEALRKRIVMRSLLDKTNSTRMSIEELLSRNTRPKMDVPPTPPTWDHDERITDEAILRDYDALAY